MNSSDLSKIRTEYSGKPLTKDSVAGDPLTQFNIWMNEALAANANEPTAMVVSTVSERYTPSSRVVLLKGVDETGFVFFTNYESLKGKQVSQNRNVALLFFWPELERQVRIEGQIDKVTEAESYEYFSSRPYESQIGAWASKQSTPLRDRDELIEKFVEFLQMYPEGAVPLPPQWGGYRVKPISVEFWQGRESRLHDRIKYTLDDSSWKTEILSP
ncbi:MAG: pyridoxamine 5'-phosphate oxidase [Ignavibacteria bacterium]|nr:pyridoxamine 5'-phosphate oxidase [Ignavibacteria bacterium]